MTNLTLIILVFLSFFTSPIFEVEISIPAKDSTALMDDELVITEIMYHPNSADSSWEWIEVYNKGTEAINLAGFVLDDNNNTKQKTANITEGIIAPGGSAILFDAGVTQEEFQDVWGKVNAIPVFGWPGLNNGGDGIGIWNSFESYDGDHITQDNTIEQVSYDDANGWPDSNAESSIYLTDIDTDNQIGEHWVLSELDSVNAFSSLELHGNTGGDIGSPGVVPVLEDTEAPTIECLESVEINSDIDFCVAQVALGLPIANDNRSTEFIFGSVRSDGLAVEDSFPVGETMIVWTATDLAGNTSEPCTQTIRVLDVQAPVAIGQHRILELDENGIATLLPQELDNLETPSYDNCSIDTFMASRTMFNCADIGGPVAVDFSVLDVNGNRSEVSLVTVTIVDRSKPILTCNPDITVQSTTGEAVELAAISEPLVTDNCDATPEITSLRSDGQELNASFDIGATTITWRATDISDNMVICIQTVLVESTVSSDKAIIAFSLPEQLLETEIDSLEKTITVRMPVGTDVHALIPSFELSALALSSPELGEIVDFTEPVSYTVTAQDGSEQEWIVSVRVLEDTTPPTFEVKGHTEDFVTELEVGDVYQVGEIVNSIDESDTTSEILGVDQVDTSLEGSVFEVVYSVSDGVQATTITETVMITTIENELLTIISFTLVNADTNEDLFALSEGMQINQRDLPTLNLNIRANTTADVMSVALALAGDKMTTRTENVLPFALYGDFPVAQYYGSEFGLGAYAVSATPYSKQNRTGDFGFKVTLMFNIVNPCTAFELLLSDVQNPITCTGFEGFAAVITKGASLPVSYAWSHNSDLIGDSAIGLEAGRYTVTATDTNNCKSEVTFELEDPVLPEVSLAPFDQILENSPLLTLVGGLPEGGVYSGEGVGDGAFDPSIGKGSYPITYRYTDSKTGCENSVVQSLKVAPLALTIISFTLVNADTNEDIRELKDGEQIDMNSLPTRNLNIRANTTSDVASVGFLLSGSHTSSRTENVAPFSVFGDFPAGNYYGQELGLGSYTITAVPYLERQATGELGTELTIGFVLYNSDLTEQQSTYLKLYPNPAVLETILSFEEPGELVTISLYDTLGRLVVHYDAVEIDENGAFLLNVAAIPAGTYYVNSQNAQGQTYQKQLMIKK